MKNQRRLQHIFTSHKGGMTLVELMVAIGVLTLIMTSWMVMTVDLPQRFYALAEQNRGISDDSYLKLFLNKHIPSGYKAETFYVGPDNPAAPVYYQYYLLKVKRPSNNTFWLIYSPCGDDGILSGNPPTCPPDDSSTPGVDETSDDRLLRAVWTLNDYDPVTLVTDIKPSGAAPPLVASSDITAKVYELCTDASCPSDADPAVPGTGGHPAVSKTPFVIQAGLRSVEVRFQHNYYHFRAQPGESVKPLIFDELVFLNSGN